MKAEFTQGSIFKHICIMTLSSTVGLMSLFVVDLVDMYWLSLLGEVELTAGLGFAGSILFFTLSLMIGLSIACGAVVSQTVGKGNLIHTKRMVSGIFISILIFIIPMSVMIFSFSGFFLTALGASGRAYILADSYVKIVLTSLPIMALVMACGGVFRALGRAKEAMYLTLIGGLVNAVLDPICIFLLNMGIEGAALATVCSRIAMFIYGIKRIFGHYQMFLWPSIQHFIQDIKVFLYTAIPAIFTNLATPIGFAITTAIIAQFGDDAIAGNTVISKLQPLVFAGIFALSGAIGPIAGQNYGAKYFKRIQRVLTTSVIFVALYCLVACSVLWFFTDYIIYIFQSKGDSALLIRWFCYGFSLIFIFNGITFVTNALFNNLNLAHWATAFNFLKATIFTIPFAYFGAHYGGLFGVMFGVLLGSACMSIISLSVAYYKILRLEPKP